MLLLLFSVPTAVQDVMASFNGTHIIITWSPPTSPNGVLSYLIDIRKRDLLTQQTNIILSALVVTELKFLINNPKAFSEYTIDVTSQTNAGIGVTQIAMLQTPEGGISRVLALVATIIKCCRLISTCVYMNHILSHIF